MHDDPRAGFLSIRQPVGCRCENAYADAEHPESPSEAKDEVRATIVLGWEGSEAEGDGFGLIQERVAPTGGACRGSLAFHDVESTLEELLTCVSCK